MNGCLYEYFFKNISEKNATWNKYYFMCFYQFLSSWLSSYHIIISFIDYFYTCTIYDGRIHVWEAIYNDHPSPYYTKKYIHTTYYIHILIHTTHKLYHGLNITVQCLMPSSFVTTLFPLRHQSLSKELPSPWDHLQDPIPLARQGRVEGSAWSGCVDGSST